MSVEDNTNNIVMMANKHPGNTKAEDAAESEARESPLLQRRCRTKTTPGILDPPQGAD